MNDRKKKRENICIRKSIAIFVKLQNEKIQIITFSTKTFYVNGFTSNIQINIAEILVEILCVSITYVCYNNNN